VMAPQDWDQQWAFPASAECLPVPSVDAHKGHLTKRNLKHARCFSGVQLTLRAVLEGVFVADRHSENGTGRSEIGGPSSTPKACSCGSETSKQYHPRRRRAGCCSISRANAGHWLMEEGPGETIGALVAFL
jgi:hypothetical protein